MSPPPGSGTSRSPQPRSAAPEEFVAAGHMRWWRRRRLLSAVILVAVLSVPLIFAWLWWGPVGFRFRPATQAAEPKILYAWVQMLPDTKDGKSRGLLARAIFADGSRCPSVQEGGRTLPMRQITPPVRSAFPVVLCEAELDGDTPAQIGDRKLPVRPAEPNDIVVIGDTGCRITYYSQEQSCGDSESWPFIKNARRAAAGITPQSFVLHLGDLHYRENACADTNPYCGGSPYGDNWQTWEADFFAPADRLLRAAPWIVMRGNHENCQRAGTGWLFFFALPGQRTNGDACEDSIRMAKYSIGETGGDKSRPRLLAVMDTSNEGSSFGKKAEREQTYLNSLDELGAAESEIWLAVHQPLWLRAMSGLTDGNKKPGEDEGKKPGDEVCDKLRKYDVLPGIRQRFEATTDKRLARLVLSGDTHVFQFFRPTDLAMPIQIVAGNGGTQLDKLHPRATPGAPCPDVDENREIKGDGIRETKLEEGVKSSSVTGTAQTFVRFGYTVLHRAGPVWSARQFDSNGEQFSECDFSEGADSSGSGRPLTCSTSAK